MSVAFARARFLGRRSGGNAVRTSAYNERTSLVDERTGERFSFDDRMDKPLHHEVMLPDGADHRFIDSAYLWNAAEKAERRSDSIVAKELLLALPAESEVSLSHKIELARSFARQHLVKHGLAVQLDVHDGHPVPGVMAAERPNVHVHIIASTRRLEGDHFASHKARDLDPVVRAHDGRAFVASADRWGELWREHQERYFERHGIETIVDPVAIHPERHGYGPRRRYGQQIEAAIHAHRQRNTEAARDPQQVLDHLRSTQRVFDGRALDRFLEAHLPAAERHGVKAQVLGRLERAEDAGRPWFAGIVEGWHRPAPSPAAPQPQRDHLADDLLRAITTALKSLDPQEQRERLAEGVDRAIYIADPAVPPSKLARSLMRVVTSALSVDEPERVLVDGTREAIRRHDLRERVREEPGARGQEPGVRDQGPRRMFGRIGRAFGAALDWIAPRVPEQAVAQARPEQAAHPVEQPSPTKELGRPRVMSEQERDRSQKPGVRSQERADSPLYQRYQQERQAAYQARETAVREVNDRFATYRAGVSAYYNTRFEIEVRSQESGTRDQRHNANEVLKAERGRDRVEAQMLRSQQVAEVRRDHPLPDWKSFVAREAERGDREAQRVLARQQARERTHERGDNDLGL